MKPTSIKFPDDLRQAIQEAADESNVSFNAFVRVHMARVVQARRTPRVARRSQRQAA